MFQYFVNLKGFNPLVEAGNGLSHFTNGII